MKVIKFSGVLIFILALVVSQATAVPICPQQAQQNRINQVFNLMGSWVDGECDPGVLVQTQVNIENLLRYIYQYRNDLPGSWQYVVAQTHSHYGDTWDVIIQQIDPTAPCRQWYQNFYNLLPPCARCYPC